MMHGIPDKFGFCVLCFVCSYMHDELEGNEMMILET